MIGHVSAPAPRLLMRLFALERLLSQLYSDDCAPRTICEIGPGLGDAASYTLSRFAPVRFDLYEAAGTAREHLKDRFGRVSEISVLSRFEASPGSYDLILAFEVVEHIEDDVRLLSDICASLAPGGRFIGSVPAFMRKWQAVDEYAGHVRRYEPDEMAGKLEEAGFVQSALTVYGAPLTNLLYLPRQLHYRSRTSGSSTEERHAATLDSGISRDLVRRFDARLVVPAVRAFAALQHLPWLASRGDGLLFHGRRPEDGRSVHGG